MRQINNRYIVQSELGAGGMGTVYRALDRLTGTTVALKRVTTGTDNLRFSTWSPESDTRLALATEFQSLASLRHPNIIPVLDYGFDAGMPFFTMQYLAHSQTITEAARGKPIQARLQLLVQVLRALTYLHRRGIIHRDLKPANALVRQDGQVMLLDFGLAQQIQQSDGIPDQVVGTLSYISPEVLQGAAATPAADLYAVGLIACEIMGGDYPYTLTDVTQLIMEIVNHTPDVSEMDMPPEIALIIQRLLAKRPDDRYDSAEAVLDELTDATGIHIEADDEATRESFLQAARFVGRESELKQLSDALSFIIKHNGGGSSWLIGGESGVGKSRLVNELQIRALVSGALVLQGQGVEGGGQFYQLWRPVMRRLCLEAAIDDTQASILSTIVPDIATLLDRPVEPPPAVADDAAQRRLLLTIADVFRACEYPIMLILEDLHWMSESLDPIKQLNKIVSDLPLIILGTYQTEERPDLPDELPGMRTLTLPRLQPDEIRQLSESMMGDAGKQPQVLDLLQQETEGNVFFLVETVRTLAAEAGKLSNIGRMTLPPRVFAGGVKQVVQRRLSHLPENYRPLLQLTAIAGRYLDPALLHHLAETDTTAIDPETWLTACVNRGVLDGQDGNWRFAHDRLREAILEDIPAEDRPALHRRVAEAMEALYADDTSRAAPLAYHWQQAQQPDHELHYTHIAAEQTRQACQFEIAIDLCNRALNLLDQQTDLDDDQIAMKTDLMCLRADCQHALSQYDAAVNSYDATFALAWEHGNITALAKAYMGLGDVAERRSDYTAARTYYEDAIEQTEQSGDEHLTAAGLNRLGNVYILQGNYEKATELLNRSLEIASRLDEVDLIASVNNNMGTMAFKRGDGRASRTYFETALSMRRRLGDKKGIAGSLNNLGLAETFAGEYDAAIVHFSESIDLKREIGDRYGVLSTLNNMGVTFIHQKRYDDAIQCHEESLALARELGDRMGIGDNLNNLGLLLRKTGGDLTQAQTYLEQSITIARDIGDRLGVALALSNLGDVLLERGETERARETLRDALQEALSINAMQPALRAMMWLARLLAQTDQHETAAETLGFVREHPYSDSEILYDLENLLNAEFQAALPDETLQTALKRGESLPQATIITRLAGTSPPQQQPDSSNA